MRGKREFIARASALMGVTRLLESVPKKCVLMVLNYHRVGSANETPYDSGTFSCTAEQLSWQIEYLKIHYQIASLEQTLEIVSRGRISEPTVLITFDDGYIDNYRIAFPILRRHAVQAAFFLPTAFVGTGRLPWWDVIAYVVKRCQKKKIYLDYPEPSTFSPSQDGLDWCIRNILQLYTRPSMQDPNRFLEKLEQACESYRPLDSTERCFLNWDEARQMQMAGMAFGSHTHTHEILSKLSKSRQQEELSLSRDILKRELGGNIDSLAYPVGTRNTFTSDTIEALHRAHYRAAFSFYGGFNHSGTVRPFNICRFGIDRQSQPRLRLQTALGTFTGKYWF